MSALDEAHRAITDPGIRSNPEWKNLTGQLVAMIESQAHTERELRRLRHWLDNNMTFFDVTQPVVEGPNVPTLATVSSRLWYHATDDQEGFPFSTVAARADQVEHGR